MRVEHLAEGVTLYLADCREVLPAISADAVICDPPYGINYETNHGATWNGQVIAQDACLAARETVEAWCGCDKPQAYFGSWKREKPVGTRATLIWDKGPASGMGDLSFPWKGSHEEIYILGEGWSGRRDEGVLRGPTMVTWESVGREHPNQKPVWLCEALIEKLPTAQTILDPFMGSGSTGVAAIKQGRGFVGIEIEERWFDVARRRIAAALGLFVQPPTGQQSLFATVQ